MVAARKVGLYKGGEAMGYREGEGPIPCERAKATASARVCTPVFGNSSIAPALAGQAVRAAHRTSRLPAPAKPPFSPRLGEQNEVKFV
jgi:hypothetical protein